MVSALGAIFLNEIDPGISNVRGYPDQIFPGGWIGRRGTMATKIPRLNANRLLFWGFLKHKIYSNRIRVELNNIPAEALWKSSPGSMPSTGWRIFSGSVTLGSTNTVFIIFWFVNEFFFYFLITIQKKEKNCCGRIPFAGSFSTSPRVFI